MGLSKDFIIQSVRKNNFRLTGHATIQRIERNISVRDIKKALLRGGEQNEGERPLRPMRGGNWSIKK